MNLKKVAVFLKKAYFITTLFFSLLLCSALFAAIRQENTDYLMTGLPLFIIVSCLFLLGRKVPKAYALALLCASAIGYIFSFFFQ